MTEDLKDENGFPVYAPALSENKRRKVLDILLLKKKNALDCSFCRKANCMHLGHEVLNFFVDNEYSFPVPSGNFFGGSRFTFKGIVFMSCESCGHMDFFYFNEDFLSKLDAEESND